MIIFLGVLILLLLAALLAQQLHFNRKEKDLLNRLMSRDFVEYRTTIVSPEVRPKRRGGLSDEEMAALEAKRRGRNGA